MESISWIEFGIEAFSAIRKKLIDQDAPRKRTKHPRINKQQYILINRIIWFIQNTSKHWKSWNQLKQHRWKKTSLTRINKHVLIFSKSDWWPIDNRKLVIGIVSFFKGFAFSHPFEIYWDKINQNNL